jgi:photosystem II stability/assembly factor-like uncharacterized protein
MMRSCPTLLPAPLLRLSVKGVMILAKKQQARRSTCSENGEDMYSFRCRVWLLAVTLLGSYSLAHAGINQWTSNGPEGGVVRAIAIDPVTPTTLYVGTERGGVLQSTDGGASWVAINNGLANTNVLALVIDPTGPSILYAGLQTGGAFKSTDGGKNWIAISWGLPTQFVSVQAFAIDPLNPMILYAGTEGGVFKSTDGGANWAATTLTGFITVLEIDPKNPAILYASDRDSVFKSTDGGRRWTPMNSGLPFGCICVSALAVDPVNPETLYVSAGGIFRSTDGGASWIGTSLTTGAFALAIDSYRPAIVYAATSIGVFQSTDGGATWTAVSNGLPRIPALVFAIDPGDSDVLYAGTEGRGIFKSTDGGTIWVARNNGVAFTFIQALAIDPRNPTTIYASVNGGHVGVGGSVFKSLDGGVTWVAINEGLTNTNVIALVVDPVNSQIIYAGTFFDGGVFKSTDGGMSWAATGLTNTHVEALAIDPSNPNILYTGVGGDVYKSTDSGTSWVFTNIRDDSAVSALAIDPTNPATIYAGTRPGSAGATSGVFKSTDGGITWAATSLIGGLGPVIESLVVAPTNPPTIYAGTFLAPSGLAKSTDGGANWTPLNPAGGLVLALASDPLNPHTIYAGTGGGILRSSDGGTTWASMNTGLTNTSVSALAIDQTSGLILYAGTRGGGVFTFQIVDTQPAGIVAYLESPEVGPVSGIAVIRGWAFATQEEEQIERVELFIDGTRSGDIPCCSQRGDVQDAFLQFPPDHTLNSGWGVVFNWGFLSPGIHTVQVRIESTSGAVFFSDVRNVIVVKPGNAEFLDQFDLSRAAVRIEGDELVAEGITVRDKATQQQRVINARFRWFEHSQSFGMVQASIVAEFTSWRSLASAFFAGLPAWFVSGPVSALAQDGFPAIAAVFESPTEGQVVSGVGIIRGWSFSDRGRVPIGLVVDEQASGLIPCCSERADVAAAFPDNPHALNSGWGTVFNYGLLTAGPHTIGVNVAYWGYSGPIDRHTVTVVKPGGFEFLDQFDFSAAQSMIQHPWSAGIQLTGVQVRDKATRQTRVIDVELRWFEHSQALGIVAASE